MTLVLKIVLLVGVMKIMFLLGVRMNSHPGGRFHHVSLLIGSASALKEQRLQWARRTWHQLVVSQMQQPVCCKTGLLRLHQPY
jgi:hypothetical protein